MRKAMSSLVPPVASQGEFVEGVAAARGLPGVTGITIGLRRWGHWIISAIYILIAGPWHGGHHG